MKIVVLDGYTLNPGDLTWDRIAEKGELKVYDRTPESEILGRIGDSEIVFTNKTPLNSDTLSKLPKLKYIGVLATGYNVVDVKAAAQQGITVTNIPTYGTASVAQFATALLLELCHHVGLHNDAVHSGEWAARGDFSFWKTPLMELAGKTLGIVGFGRIGKAFAAIGEALGMNVIAYDSYMKPSAVESVGFEDLLARADVISLHCPLTPENTGMLNAETLAKTKRGVLVINTSRGPLVDETAMRDALISGQVGGAALDVVSSEPIKADNPLLDAPNCIITPHIAWAPREARERLMNIAADNLEAFLSGSPVNTVC